MESMCRKETKLSIYLSMLLDCIEFSHVRPQFYRDIYDLKTLFDKVPCGQILGFVKAIGLYYKL